MMILVFFFRIYQNKEVARCYHGYCSYAPLSDIVKHQNLCTIPSSSRICIQISFTYPALPKPLSRPLFSFCLSTNYYEGKLFTYPFRPQSGHIRPCGISPIRPYPPGKTAVFPKFSTFFQIRTSKKVLTAHRGAIYQIKASKIPSKTQKK